VNWKTVNYRTHRWLGIALGFMTFVWFASGIAMMYYPWPAPTASEELRRLAALQVDGELIAFDSAITLARRSDVVGGRLSRWNGRLTYALWEQHGSQRRVVAMMDARTGTVLSPIGEDAATAVAAAWVAPSARASSVTLLDAGDHYLLSNEYRHAFPAYVVQFADDRNTAVYVSRAGGYVVGIVSDRTRWTTWFGTVPHWLYFKWLYSRHIEWWLWVSYVLPAIAMIAGASGIVIGVHQLLPHCRRGQWRISAYRGASQWHHIAGVVFGAFVLTWSLSGLLEVLGPDVTPRASHVAAVRGIGDTRGAVRERDAMSAAARVLHTAREPIAVDYVHVLGSPAYVVRFAGGERAFVDATTGAARAELNAADAASLARVALARDTGIRSVERLDAYDAYYYARYHRELPLPAYRVVFADDERTRLYIDAVSGEPVGYVDPEVRSYRWLRDGLHSMDVPVFNERRGLWQLIVLPLMLGGTLIAASGLWLAIRRLRRVKL